MNNYSQLLQISDNINKFINKVMLDGLGSLHVLIILLHYNTTKIYRITVKIQNNCMLHMLLLHLPYY